jgi:hypothetical protein
MSILGQLGNVISLFYEEIEVARYIVLAESAGGGFSIPDAAGISDHHFLDIEAPGLLQGSSPVIFFRTTHAGSPLMSVRLNDAQLIVHTFADSDTAPPGMRSSPPTRCDHKVTS